MNKLEFNIDVFTDYIMGGAEVLTFNKDEMRGIVTGTIEAINKAEIRGGVKGFVIGVGCCAAATYGYRKASVKKQVESK